MTQNQDDSMDLEEEQYYYEEEEGEDLFGGAAQQQSSSLNASFDASLFRQNMPALSSNNHYELRNATSWDERDRAQEQQQLSIELPDLPPPRSMRKTGRRLSQLEQSTPVRLRFRPPGSSVKKSGKLTPASAKRHKALNKARLRDIIRPSTSAQKESSQRDFVLRDNDCPDTSHLAFSAIKPPKVSLNSLAPAAPNSTLLETTSETTESADTDSSTPFRFTSFPASLPRINNPRTERQQPSCPATIRKRMSFGDNHAVLQHRDNDDGTHNTSLSSIGHYDYSDDDDDDDSTIGTPMARTRLDFSMNHHHSPRVVGDKKGELLGLF